MHGRAPATIRTNLYGAAYFLSWCERSGLAYQTVTQDDLTRFFAWYSTQASQSSLVRRFASIHFFFDWLCDAGIREDNPAAGFKFTAPATPPQRPFTIDELHRLLDTARTPRERAMVLMFLSTGCRLSELVRMHTQDIDGDTIMVRGKGNKQRLVAPGRAAMQALSEYLGWRSGPVWLSVYGNPLSVPACYFIIRRLGQRCGVHAFPHRFRTTFANLFDTATASDVQSLQILLGHVKIQTTLRYAEWNAVARALEQQRRFAVVDQLTALESVS